MKKAKENLRWRVKKKHNLHTLSTSDKPKEKSQKEKQSPYFI